MPPPPADRWSRRAFSSLGVANFRWYLLGQGASVLGLWMRAAAQGWLVYRLTGSEVLLGTVSALFQGCMGLASPLGGALADRERKHRLLRRLSLVAGLPPLLLGLLVLTGRVEVWHVLAMAAALGAVRGFETPTRQSFLVEVVGREHLSNAIVLNTAVFNTARILGPALAGGLIAGLAGVTGFAARTLPAEWRVDAALAGIALCYVADGLSYFLFAWVLGRVRPVPVERAPAPRGWWMEIREGWSYARGDLRVRTLLTLLAIVVGLGWSYAPLMPALAEGVLGLGPGGYGALMAVNGVGALAGALWVAGRPAPVSRAALRREVFRSVAIAAGGVLILATARSSPHAGAGLAVAGFGTISFISRGNSLVQAGVPDALRGRVMSLWVLVLIGAGGVGGLLVGAAAERWGVPRAIFASAVLCLLLAAGVALRLPPPSDGTGAPPPPSPAPDFGRGA